MTRLVAFGADEIDVDLSIINVQHLKIFAAAPGRIQNGGGCKAPAVKPRSEWMKSADPSLLSRIAPTIVSLPRQGSKARPRHQTVTLTFSLFCVTEGLQSQTSLIGCR